MKSSESMFSLDLILIKKSIIFLLAVYTQLTDRQLSIDKRLDLTEQYWNTESKQMIFDWLSGLVINRKK
jgi:hypothetical protein